MDILLSRQPIFSRDERVAGYEISYRGRTRDGAAVDAAPSLVVDAVLGIGLARITDGHPAFLNVTREMVESGSLELLDRNAVVLKLEAGADATDPAFIAACERLKGNGYRLAAGAGALVGGGSLLPLLDIVRVDLQAYAGPALTELADRLRPYSVRLLAENVRNVTVRDLCVEVGFELFQGYDFSRPEVLTGRDLPVDYLRTALLMQQIRDFDVTDTRIEEEFRTDLSLSYKLLRMVNSASVGGRGVQSIGHAIRLLGRETLYRWLALLLLASAADTGVRAEIVHTALLRARLCELLAKPVGRAAEAGSFYITGLMSLLDILLATPMEELVSNMGLAAQVRSALIAREGFHGTLLRLVEAYDLGHWEEFITHCGEIGLPQDEVGSRYLEALSWANELAGGLGEG